MAWLEHGDGLQLRLLCGSGKADVGLVGNFLVM